MRCRIVRAAVLLLVSSLSVPALATDADDRTADQLFGYSYGEGAPTQASSSQPRQSGSKGGSDKLELEFRGSSGESFLDHEPRRGTKLKQFGISGMGTGGSLLGLGGLIFLGSRFVDKGTTSRTALSHGGLTLLSVGGALFLAGGIMLGIDAARTPAPMPMPTPDGRGAQVVYFSTF
ncbi:MAG: hypothetical protein LBM75_09070 [Myxococcales bacterium]|jgi:hypothetical protein|nr:hypothetical protein [Myxococcales bacterium]